MTADEVRKALTDIHALVFAAHERCLELTKAGVRGFDGSPLGMSHGPFSKINEICAAWAKTTQEIERLANKRVIHG